MQTFTNLLVQGFVKRIAVLHGGILELMNVIFRWFVFRVWICTSLRHGKPTFCLTERLVVSSKSVLLTAIMVRPLTFTAGFAVLDSATSPRSSEYLVPGVRGPVMSTRITLNACTTQALD